MSTLKVDNLSTTDGANTATSSSIVRGTVKAWCNFNGTGTIAIRDAYNVTSLTDNGVGDYSINLTSSLGTANGVDWVISGVPINRVTALQSTVSSRRMQCQNSSFANADPDVVEIGVIG